MTDDDRDALSTREAMDVLSLPAVRLRQVRIIQLMETVRALAVVLLFMIVALGILIGFDYDRNQEALQETRRLARQQKIVVCDLYRVSDRPAPEGLEC
jgi:hypothetical protein